MTACNGDPDDSASWRREIIPLCSRCERLIRQTGDEGRRLKATGERWYGGHRVGRRPALHALSGGRRRCAFARARPLQRRPALAGAVWEASRGDITRMTGPFGRRYTR